MSPSILVLNCGSSSLKYQLVDPVTERVLASGNAERIGEPTGVLTHQVAGEAHRVERALPDHQAAMAAINDAFAEHGPALAEAGVQAVGHRVVHGGDRFSQPTVITDEVVAEIDELSALAPLHNPPAVVGIAAARALHHDVPHVAVFDTAFFADLPEAAWRYAIDVATADRHRVRRYGFHGTSHGFVAQAAAEFVGREVAELNQIVLHLGNGASASAIQNGSPIDTSMGLTPLEGLVMGTRSGDIDPGVHSYLMDQAKLTGAEVSRLLNKQSGLRGLTGEGDFRQVMRRRAEGDRAAALAFDIYVRRIVKYVGSYLALLGRVDVLSFTAGVGEHNAELRAAVLAPLAGLGFTFDPARNESGSGARAISPDGSPVTVLVVPTNEELAIARATLAAAGR